MENNYYKNISFRYSFRDYQQRVLDTSDEKLKDNKLHIVAAPGSGKTILGLEMIRRLGQKALVFAPSISIREQWAERFLEGFVQESKEAQEEWMGKISNDLERPEIITCVTYQALYQHLSKETMEQLAELLKANNITTICLDEAHHLQREWWKALETLIASLGEIKLIALTATPPYDSTNQEWQRYIDLCGEIDMEIYAPEMVQKRCICPYQDYIYMCLPDDDDNARIADITSDRKARINQILKREDLYRQIMKHIGLKQPELCFETFSKNPEYVNALIEYLQIYAYQLRYDYEENRKAADEAFDVLAPSIRELIQNSELNQNLSKVEDIATIEESNTFRFAESKFFVLMEGIINKDAASYDETFIEDLKNELTHKLLYRDGRLVKTRMEDQISDILRKSNSRFVGVENIVDAEMASLGDSMRCLILTDRVRRECLDKIETSEVVGEPGCVSIFESLRRREHLKNIEEYMEYKGDEEVKNKSYNEAQHQDNSNESDTMLGMICATFAILPQSVVDSEEFFHTYTELKHTEYVQIAIDDHNRKDMLREVTRIFTEGKIKVLIGTVAYLGEGWDAPCVNSVIIASTVATYVQTNQMRGRGFRINKLYQNKTANLWHLLVLKSEGMDGYIPYDDYDKLRNRFDSILGINEDGSAITSGIERIGIDKRMYTQQQVETINRHSIEVASEREKLYQKWMNLTSVVDTSKVVYVVNVADDRQNSNAEILDKASLWKKMKMRRMYTKNFQSMKFVGNAIMDTMKNLKMISEDVELIADYSRETGKAYVGLNESNNKINRNFAEAIKECVMEVNDTRYVIKGADILKRKYIAVPGLFDKHKEEAEMFFNYFQNNNLSWFSRNKNRELIYTRNELGKKALFEARLEVYSGTKKNVTVLKEIYKAM